MSHAHSIVYVEAMAAQHTYKHDATVGEVREIINKQARDCNVGCRLLAVGWTLSKHSQQLAKSGEAVKQTSHSACNNPESTPIQSATEEVIMGVKKKKIKG